MSKSGRVAASAFILFLVGPAAVLSAAESEVDQTSACPDPEARQFDFWVGDWDVENRHRNPQRPENPSWFGTGVATNRVYSILDGCAVVEHWEGQLVFGSISGFSVRAFDPVQEKWVLVLYWPSAAGGSFSTLQGVFRHGRGEFYNTLTNAQGEPVESRFTFSDVSRDSLRWDSATSADGGISWTPGWIMEFKRRSSLTDRPLFNGPALSNSWCTEPQARSLDFMIGNWTGTVGEESLSVRVLPILNGCALIDFVEIESPPKPTKRFRVRAFDVAQGKWLQYSIDSLSPIFERAEGSVVDGSAVLTSSAVEGLPLYRETWTPAAGASLLWRRESSTDAGASWAAVGEAQLTKQQ